MKQPGERMWLLPIFSLLSRVTAHLYYRLNIAGEVISTEGPVLLVANHPNSLLDPVLVAAAARRPVRFLAKAPLFIDRKVGWLVRGSGAIPVYRRIDAPVSATQNVEMFRAAFEALSNDAAIGIFPEGLSHSDPELQTLKTGAARIVLGAYQHRSRPFPIVPIGILLREKDRFRSEAAIIRGHPVEWADLAERGPTDVDAVRTLTNRIDDALRHVTLNLERWEDKPLIECAEAIWSTEWQARSDQVSRVARLEITSSLLRALRRNPARGEKDLVRDVRAHCRRLSRLHLAPAQLGTDVRLRTGFRWAIRRAYLVAIPALVLALLGFILFWVPYRVTGVMSDAARQPPDRRATYKLLIGIVCYAGWLLLLTITLAITLGITAGLVGVVIMPMIGMAGLLVRERWRGSWHDARRFFVIRGRHDLVRTLRQEQHELALRLQTLYETWAPTLDARPED